MTCNSRLHFCREIGNFLSMNCCSPLWFCSNLKLVWMRLNKNLRLGSYNTIPFWNSQFVFDWHKRLFFQRNEDRKRERGEKIEFEQMLAFSAQSTFVWQIWSFEARASFISFILFGKSHFPERINWIGLSQKKTMCHCLTVIKPDT